ncbi:MAG: hypothetical protein AB1546_11065 [bacterium]
MQLPKFPDEVTRIKKMAETEKMLTPQERGMALLELYEISEEILSKCPDREQRLKIMQALREENNKKLVQFIKDERKRQSL